MEMIQPHPSLCSPLSHGHLAAEHRYTISQANVHGTTRSTLSPGNAVGNCFPDCCVMQVRYNWRLRVCDQFRACQGYWSTDGRCRLLLLALPELGCTKMVTLVGLGLLSEDVGIFGAAVMAHGRRRVMRTKWQWEERAGLLRTRREVGSTTTPSLLLSWCLESVEASDVSAQEMDDSLPVAVALRERNGAHRRLVPQSSVVRGLAWSWRSGINGAMYLHGM